MTTTISPSPDIPLPAGAVDVYDSTDDNQPLGVLADQSDPNASRYFTGAPG
jgi:hypothetical protein